MRPLLCAAAICVAQSGAARADVLEVRSEGTVAVLASDRGGLAGAVTDSPAAIEAGPDIPVAAVTTIGEPSVPTAFREPLKQAAMAAGISPTLLSALVWQESRWRTSALSPKGARGLTQLMPATARALAVDPTSAASNLAGGARYLRSMLDMFGGDVERALAAYNAGPRRVLRSAGVPPITETRAYVSKIIDRLGTTEATVLEGDTQ
jgi:soluble lytic murein transglycosylase-like protein